MPKNDTERLTSCQNDTNRHIPEKEKTVEEIDLTLLAMAALDAIRRERQEQEEKR